MRTFSKTIVVLGIGIMGLSSLVDSAEATILWDETTQPDLSNARTVPTKLPDLMPGENLLTIVVDNPRLPETDRSLRDLDYFSFSVPDGLVLSNIFLTEYIEGDDVAFMGMQQGTEFTEPAQPPVPPDTELPDPTNLLGYGLIGTKTTYSDSPGCQDLGIAGDRLPPGTVVQLGQDLLPVLGDRTDRLQPNSCLTISAPMGFTSPLSAGDYVFWVQQTTFLPPGPPNTQFQLNFVANTVPETSSALGLLAFGLLGVSLVRKKY